APPAGRICRGLVSCPHLEWGRAMSETILIVDDEESVRRTFEEWLQTSGLECRILAAADAEAALRHANQSPIDLAVLEWNLGAGQAAPCIARFAVSGSLARRTGLAVGPIGGGAQRSGAVATSHRRSE